MAAALDSIRLGGFEIFRIVDATIEVGTRTVFGNDAGLPGAGRLKLALNVFAVAAPRLKFLVDTGAGSGLDRRYRSFYSMEGGGRLFEGLASLGWAPEDIELVFHTHLHFDHCGGDITPATDGGGTAAFPQAVFVVQKSAWEYALRPDRRDKPSYFPERTGMLGKAPGGLRLIEGNTTVGVGLEAVPLPGHAVGHQGLKLTADGWTLLFCGDAVPLAAHVGLRSASAFDLDPGPALATRRSIFERAAAEGWTLAFAHEAVRPWGRVGRSDEGFFVRT